MFNRRTRVTKKTIPIGIALIGLFLTTVPLCMAADVQLTIVPNRFFHEDNDPFSIEADLSGYPGPVDLYLAIEIEGSYYFYPSWTTDAQFERVSVPDSEGKTVSIIPLITLPPGLPHVVATLYSACTQPGTYDLASNVEIVPILLQGTWPELPTPDADNTFHLMPGEKSIGPGAPVDLYQDFANLIHAHFPLKGPYMRHGISMLHFIDTLDPSTNAQMAAEKAHAAQLALGLHVGFTNHHVTGLLDSIRRQDRRNNQWESNGEIFMDSGNGDLEAITPSRYATSLRDARRSLIEHSAEGVLSAKTSFPDTLVFINGPIEVEMRRAYNEELHYADYSPFAIAEFRDWLRHSGPYSDTAGIYANEGVPRSLIDNMDFSNDPSPAVHSGSGPSFNEYFGTAFSTWNLQYWDPDLYPGALPLSADPVPGTGQTGFLSGGFDAPRMVNNELVGGNERFQGIWDGYFSPTTYGFRQVLIHHYVTENSQWYQESGIPQSMIYTHQIPADYLGNWIRHLGSASPFWTSWNPYSRIGYTMFFDTTQQESLFSVTQDLSPDWGIFEYHPAPFMDEDTAFFFRALELVYQYRAHIVCPLELVESWEGDYQLIDTPFEYAFNQFFSQTWPGTVHRRFDQPFTNATWIDYVPPPVRDVQFSNGTLSWNPVIWPSRPEATWSVWGEFDRFEVYRGDTNDFQPTPRNRIAVTTSYSLSGLPSGNYKVLAFSRLGLCSPQ